MGKGSNWERDIAKFLTKWASGKEKPYVFWRAPGSGSMATLSEENKEISGDIVALRIEGAFLTDKYSIEAKNGYPNANFHKHLKSNKNDEIKSFWEQCCRDAFNANKRPLLILRKKGYNAIVGISCNEIINKIKDLNSISMAFENEYLPSVCFFDMKSFFDRITPDDIRKLK
jgi:hypothetical protein